MFDDFLHSEAVSIWRRVVSYVSYLILWLIYAASTFWLILQIEEILITGAMRLRLNPWQLRAVDKFGLVFLGLGWLISSFLVENYLRHGAARMQLLHRTGKVYLGLMVFSGIVIGLNALL